MHSHRCIFGHKPGKFDATRAQLLANFAELVVRQIEANWALKLQQKRDASQLARSLACYDLAYLLVDVAQPEWRVLYVNKAAQKQLGASFARGVWGDHYVFHDVAWFARMPAWIA